MVSFQAESRESLNPELAGSPRASPALTRWFGKIRRKFQSPFRLNIKTHALSQLGVERAWTFRARAEPEPVAFELEPKSSRAWLYRKF